MGATIATTKIRISGFGSDELGHPVLMNHRTQSSTTINGWASTFFGVPFLAIGVFASMAALNQLHARKNAPNWVVGVVACMFALGGLFFIAHGLHGIVRKAAYKREAAQRPGEPWLYDHHWHREGVSFSAFDDMLNRLLAAMFWTAFLLPFGWVGLKVRGAWPFLVGVAIFGLVGLIFWFRWVQMLMDLLRYGNSFLTYEEFPFALGGTVRARLKSPHNISAIDQLTLTLRCVQEKYVTTGGRGQDRTTSVVCYELYKDEAVYDRDRLTGLAGNDIPVEFRVPADQPTTNLTATPPIYWEIEARGTARGADYEAVFLVPVYKVS